MVVARHRSPQGRRAHLGLPTPAIAPVGAGGAYRQPAPRFVGSSLSESLPGRLAAAAVAGSVLAAAGQMALTEALPSALDGTNLLRAGLGELLEPATASASTVAAAAPVGAAFLPAVAPVAPEPQVVGASELIKAVELDRIAVEQAARAAAEARQAEEDRIAEAARAEEVAESTTTGGVQMMVGRITSGFGPRWNAQHKGLDVAAPIGTPIRVPLDGTVIDSGPASGFGLWVRVRHADGTITLYGHIDRTLVEVGQRVSAGEVIAEVGNTGRSTGPHLHFEVITSGGNVNPTPWLAERGIGVT